jgi:hypothetical protein
MAKPACTELSPVATNAIRGLGVTQREVLRATLWDLRPARGSEDDTDRVSVDGRPWRWHLVGKHVIEYRSLTVADKNARCPKGGFFVQNVVRVTPEILAYMRT